MRVLTSCALVWIVILSESCLSAKHKEEEERAQRALEAFQNGSERQDAGDARGAISAYREALEMSPFFPFASWNLAHLYQVLELAEPAVEALTRALEEYESYRRERRSRKKRRKKKRRGPRSKQVASIPTPYIQNALSSGNVYTERVRYECGIHFYLGNLKSAVRVDGSDGVARRHYDAAVEACPDFADAYFRRASTSRDPAVSARDLREAIRLRPTFPEAFVNLGSALKDLGQLQASVDAYDAGIALDPSSAAAHANRGVTLQAIGRVKDAIDAYKRAKDLRPDIAMLNYNLAQALEDGAREFERDVTSDVITSYREALRIDPTIEKAFCGLFNALSYQLDWAQRSTMIRRLRAEDGRSRDDVMSCVRSFYGATFSLSPRQALTVARREAKQAKDDSNIQQRGAGECWATLFASSDDNDEVRNKEDGRLRVSFVSSDFGGHTVGNLLHRVFERFDRRRLKIRGVALSASDGTMFRTAVEASTESFDVILPDASDREAFRALARSVDILVDLNGFSKGGRFAALAGHPAFVTAAYIGFPSSTGGLHDISITDNVATPPEIALKYYDEPLLMLTSSTYLATSHAAANPLDDSDEKLSSLEAHALEELLRSIRDGRLILCNFGQLYKVTPAMLTVWADVMRRVPRSVLWMVRHRSMSDSAIANFRSELAIRGVAPRRLIMTPMIELSRHLHVKRKLADLSLDSFPYNGHSVTADVLWTSIPHVTVIGEMTPSRVATSMLNSLGVDVAMTTTHSLREFSDVAVRIASSQIIRRSLREKLYAAARTRKTSAFDIAYKARHLERAMHALWDATGEYRSSASDMPKNANRCPHDATRRRLPNVVVDGRDIR